MAEPVLGLRSEIEVELGVDGPAQAQKTAQPATTPRKPATAASRHLTNMMHSLREGVELVIAALNVMTEFF